MDSTLLGREVSLWLFAARAVVLCLIAFGLKWTGDQVAAFMLAVEAVLAVVARQSVTPNATIRDAGFHPAEIKTQALMNRQGTGDGGPLPSSEQEGTKP